VAVSVFWAVGNGICGALPLDTWPFTCYPRWDYWGEPVKPSIAIEAFDDAGNEIATKAAMVRMNRVFNPTRWDPLLMRVSLAGETSKQRAMCAGLWEMLARESPELRRADRVHFYETTVWVHPDHAHEPPTRRVWIHTFTAEELETGASASEGRTSDTTRVGHAQSHTERPPRASSSTSSSVSRPGPGN
jgi:hypothetical protein